MWKMKENPLDYFLSTCYLLSGLCHSHFTLLFHSQTCLLLYIHCPSFVVSFELRKDSAAKLYFELFTISPASSAKD